MTRHAFICDAVRTPFGRYGGALSSVRADDLGAVPLAALMARNPAVDWQAVADVIYGCANQAGEDNRNVARMSALLAGLPLEVPGSTVNRLCGSGLDALGTAARAIKSGEAGLMIAGGVESMSRAPFVMPKAESAFSRSNSVEDTTIGWRFVNRLMKEERAPRRRLDAANRGERRRRVRHRPRVPGPDGAGFPAAGPGGAGEWRL
jgi:acetyl-CoA acetyltransferase